MVVYVQGWTLMAVIRLSARFSCTVATKKKQQVRKKRTEKKKRFGP